MCLFASRQVILVGAVHFLGGMMMRIPLWRLPLIEPPLASTMKLTRNLRRGRRKVRRITSKWLHQTERIEVSSGENTLSRCKRGEEAKREEFPVLHHRHLEINFRKNGMCSIMRVELAEIPTQEIRKTNILPFSTHTHTHRNCQINTYRAGFVKNSITSLQTGKYRVSDVVRGQQTRMLAGEHKEACVTSPQAGGRHKKQRWRPVAITCCRTAGAERKNCGMDDKSAQEREVNNRAFTREKPQNWPVIVNG